MAATAIELGSMGRGNMGTYQRLPSESHLGDYVDQIPEGSDPAEVQQATNKELNRPTHKPHSAPSSSSEATNDRPVTRSTVASEKWWSTSLMQCFFHAIPLAVTLVVVGLNIFGVYWQDLGLPHQKAVLQALQYAAKAHEIMMTASMSAIVIHRAQHDLNDTQGMPFGLLTGGFKLGEPLYLCTSQFLGASVVRKHSNGRPRLYPISILILVGVLLTSVVGPSSAVAMIPRLDWWDVLQANAFGKEYKDRVYFNRTGDELWPKDITNAIYANTSLCSPASIGRDCAVSAMDSVVLWMRDHQNQGTKPNITIFQDSEITRYLTSQGGPPDNSSWTVTSTVNSIFGRDLVHYWDWLVENATLPKTITRPLIRPHFVNSSIKFKKPLVQTQCQTWIEPDWANEDFIFPHDELLTPPLDTYKHETWKLPNDFVLNLKDNDKDIGNPNDTQHSPILFGWFDAASNFSAQGAPSLGAVILYKAVNSSNPLQVQDALTACSVDGRWAPAVVRDTITLYQTSPNPMDILHGTAKAPLNDLVKMRISLEWADTINVNFSSSPPTSVVEYMLGQYGSSDFIYPEPEHFSYYVMKSLEWRLSTALGLYITEALAQSFQDINQGSMLYRQAKNSSDSYVRYLNNVNEPQYKEGYRNGRLDWVETRDPRWNNSILPWDEWAPRNGYSEITFAVQRNGYGYGFESLPTVFAATVLIAYVIIVTTHIVLLIITGRVYRGCSDAGQMVALAWSSPAAPEFKCSSGGVQDAEVWKRMVKVEEDEQQLLLRPKDD
ncbi:MAG: hypothetical protein Q9191_007362 [Dirinaria sp. TL-2023a]